VATAAAALAPATAACAAFGADEGEEKEALMEICPGVVATLP